MPDPLVFVDEFFVKHPTEILAAELVGVDAEARYCDHPSLLMTLLPGVVHVEEPGSAERAVLLAEQLAAIHRVTVDARPREYQAWSFCTGTSIRATCCSTAVGSAA
ncbi:hypothetical protein [Kribbella sp. CA-293567]|uniref:hypothetical protein n=1 Tax=Kribbella sp. CA-293567 TaxID=3002436 RepID=UPI0022DD42C5|nr:hypothetical protein [Kribbella sp. CA-293567]WBQ04020.1 hypothetical protein OX958_29140 [Kribbella sp. CA-293567]